MKMDDFWDLSMTVGDYKVQEGGHTGILVTMTAQKDR